jgi:diguanylate cyclase (GGDEF)-like protein/putative nucleotidyltransferase with HDIG domain
MLFLAFWLDRPSSFDDAEFLGATGFSMRQLTLTARAFLTLCYLLALATAVWLSRGSPAGLGTVDDWIRSVVLAVLAGAAQVFVVQRARTHYSDHLTPVPLFAAFLLLPWLLLVAVAVLAFVPEWLWYHRKWFVQLFNIASWIIALGLGRLTLSALGGEVTLRSVTHLPAGPIIASLLVVLGAQTSLLATVLRLARGQWLRQTGLLNPGKLLVDISLLCAGWMLAAVWLIDPLYGIAALVPLVLMFQALHVPNLREEASTDSKTGLANMRHFGQVFERELERARRSGQPLSLLVGDLDYLRNINNTFGHATGDAVLVGVANILRQSIRIADLAGRFGGEEFCVLLVDTDTDADGALLAAERIRHAIEQTSFHAERDEREVRATMSIGIASCPLDGRTIESLMYQADLAVYKAKREGRNRVVAASRETRELAADWARENLVPHDRLRASAPSNPIRRFIGEITRSEYVSGAPEIVVGKDPAGPHVGQQRVPSVVGPLPVSLSVLALIGVVFVAGLVGFRAEATPLDLGWTPPLSGLILFTVLTVLAENIAVDVFGRGKTSVTVMLILGAGFLYGPLGSLATVLAFAACTRLKTNNPPHRMLFNFGMALLAAEASTVCFQTIAGGTVVGQSVEVLILAGAGAGFVYYATNHALVSLVRSLTEGRTPWQIWSEHYQWLWPHYVVLGALSAVVALGYRYLGGFGLIALASPVAMMHLAIKQYVSRTAVYVSELERVTARLGDSYESTLLALTRALDTRDDETAVHAQRVRRYAELLARRLGVSEADLEDLSRGALLHDIGKIGVPDAILLKPFRLTEEELTIMRRHPVIGYSMIVHIPFLTAAAEIVLHHHEAFDGSGYPSGLRGDQIPLAARIFSVADALDAMTSDRPYRRALPLLSALAEVQRCRGTQFDPRIVDALLAIPLPDLTAIGRGEHETTGRWEGLFGGGTARPRPVAV